MPSIRIRMMCLATAWVALGGASVGHADEPQVAFAVKAGWVDIRLQHEGTPVSGATVQIVDAQGNKFAEGETGDDGDGKFPLPRGSQFTVELKIGDRVADPICLTKVGTGVVPTEVLLSYGLRPCCRIAAMKSAERGATSEPPPSWLPAAGAAGTVFLGIVIGMLIFHFSSWGRLVPKGGNQ